jgi:phage shock protein E
MNIKEVVKTGKGTIIDVRTPEEFSGGSVKGAINIPLHQLPDRIEELHQLQKPLVLCCASGNRSGRAQQFLASQGVPDALNGGSWLEVNAHQNN